MDLVADAVTSRAAWAWLALGLAVATCVAPSATGAQFLSPGHLAQAHASLDNDTACSRCHEGGRGINTGACLSCHQDVGARIHAGAGLHGHAYAGRPCGQCHVEHLGASSHLTRWPGGGREHFDHALTGWALEGGHAAVACARCHGARNSRGAPTFLGARRECRGCHEDPHAGRMGADCASCHGMTRWHTVQVAASFDHARARFPLRGAHARVACAGCHGNPARYTGLEFSSCTSCHQDPHRGSFGATCTNCHTEASWTEIGGDIRSHHPGLSLAGGHANVACATCHNAGINRPPSRGSSCVSCHHDPHDAPLGRNCAECHASIRWSGLPRPIGLRAHEKITAWVLKGAHLDVDCGACHDPSQRPQQRFRELHFAECRDCHREDPHRGEFASRGGGECGTCHDDTAFRPSRFGVALHATTHFPLEGRHEAVACTGCHSADVAAGGGHAPPAQRLRFTLPAQACADCHQNPHGTQFQAEMASGGCAHCHEPAGWDRPHVDHSIFPLTGAHATTPCSGCHQHVSTQARQQLTATAYRGVTHECAGCHDDEHAGQFRLTSPRRACQECHTTEAFEIESFDHRRLAGWALDGRHAAVPCAGCHPTETLHSGATAVRYRLGYQRCSDCHADPHSGGPPPRDGGTR